VKEIVDKMWSALSVGVGLNDSKIAKHGEIRVTV